MGFRAWSSTLHSDEFLAEVDAVYYNNLVALNGAVSHSGDEAPVLLFMLVYIALHSRIEQNSRE